MVPRKCSSLNFFLPHIGARPLQKVFLLSVKNMQKGNKDYDTHHEDYDSEA